MPFSMFRLSALVTSAVLLTAAATPAPQPVPAQSQPVLATELLSHRAFYKISLDSAKNDSDVKAAQGLMMVEWQDACDGWIVQQKMDIQFTHEEGEGAHLLTNYTTWESKDGLRYSFNYRSTVNDNPHESFRGSASLPALGEEGMAYYTVPEKTEVKLPAGTLFPAMHTITTLKAAQDKQPMFVATVFDGTDKLGLSEINTVIGAQQAVKLDVAKEGLAGPAMTWPLRMAFFDYGENKPEPEYEMDTNLLPNGVSEFMLIDYSKFRLRGELEKIEILPKSGC